MLMIKCYFEGWRKSFDFQGRSTRKKFWWFVFWDCLTILFFLFSATALNKLSLSALRDEGSNPNLAIFTDTASFLSDGAGYLFVILLVVTILPRLAISVRRLRDAGRSVLWLLIFFVPVGSLFLWILFMEPSRYV